MDSFRCKTCLQSFPTSSALLYHHRSSHQKSTKIRYKGDIVDTEVFTVEGKWTCRCEKVYVTAVTLRKHAKRCNGIPQSTSTATRRRRQTITAHKNADVNLVDFDHPALREFDEFHRQLKSSSFDGGNPRLLSLFIRRMGFDKLRTNLSDVSNEVLLELLQIPSDPPHSDMSTYIMDDIRGLSAKIRDAIYSSDLNLRRKVMSSDQLATPTVGFNINQTHDKYEQVLLKLIRMVTRIRFLNIHNFLPPFPHTIQNQIASYSANHGPDQLLQLLIQLFERIKPWTESTQNLSCPVYLFIFLSSLSASGGGWAYEAQITPVLAAIQWWIRGTVLLHCVTEINDFKSSTIPNTPHDQECRINNILKFVYHSNRSIMETVKETLALAFHVSNSSTNRLPQITWDPEAMPRYTSLQIKGIQLSVVDIGIVAKKSLDKAEEILKSIVKGARIEGVINYTSIADDFRDRSPDYSFLNDARNGFEKFKNFLWKTFLANEESHAYFMDSTNAWNTFNIQSWIHLCSTFMNHLFVTIHLTAGQPPRAEEATTFTLKNSETSTRCLFWLKSQFFIAQRYFKTEAIQNREKSVVRFIPENVSRLLLKYLVFVKPLEIFFTKLVFDEGKARLCEETLFFRDGRRHTGASLSLCLRTSFLDHLGKNIAIAEYRHIASAFLQRLVKGYGILEEKECNEEDSAYDLQAGHSSRTADLIYANSTIDPIDQKDLFHAFQLCSLQWVKVIKFNTGHTSTSTSRTCTNPLPPRLSLSLSQSTAVNNHSNTEITTAPPMATSLNIDIVTALKSFFQNPQARFKSREQHHALSTVLFTKEDLLVILPTGGGKSVLFLFPPFYERTHLTIVVLPLIGLTQDMLARAKRHGVKAAMYESSSRINEETQLILISLENAVSPSFLEFATMNSTRIKRIVIDEIHLALTWNDFRPHYWSLFKLKATTSLPIILLSASLPPRYLQLLETCLKSNFKVIRASTERPNISYTVTEVISKEFLPSAITVVVDFLANLDYSKKDKLILFCMKRKEVEDMAQKIGQKHQISYYHGGLDNKEKMIQFQKWSGGETQVMVATKAFGMGIDYPSVRVVVHLGLSSSLLDFFQESGRAGRDGKEASSVVIYNEYYAQRYVREIQGGSTQGSEGTVELDAVQDMMKWCKNSSTCRRHMLHHVVDDDPFAPTCVTLREYLKCDICKIMDDESTRRMRPATATPILEEIVDTIPITESSEHNMMDEESSQRMRPATSMPGDDEYFGEDEEIPDDILKQIDDALAVETVNGEREIRRAANERNTQLAQSALAAITSLATKLQSFFQDFDENCMQCYIAQTSYNHASNSCGKSPRMVCFRCYKADHYRTNCPVQKIMLKKNGSCFICGLPHVMNEWHMGPISKSCVSWAKDKLLKFCWLIRHDHNAFLHLSQHFKIEINSDEEYMRWLWNVEAPDGLNNAVLVANHFIPKI